MLDSGKETGSGLDELLLPVPKLHDEISSLMELLEQGKGYDHLRGIVEETVELYDGIKKGEYYAELRKVCRLKGMDASRFSKQENSLFALLKDTTSLIRNIAESIRAEVYTLSAEIAHSDSLNSRECLVSYCLLYETLIEGVKPEKGVDGLYDLVDSSMGETGRFNQRFAAEIRSYAEIEQDYLRGSLDKQSIAKLQARLKHVRSSVKQLKKKYRRKAVLKGSDDISHWSDRFNELDVELESLKDRKKQAMILRDKLILDERVLECDRDMEYLASLGSSNYDAFLKQAVSTEKLPVYATALMQDNKYLRHRLGVCRKIEKRVYDAVSCIKSRNMAA